MQPERPGAPYERLGGEAGLRRLVSRFYALMDELPEAHGIRKLHPPDLTTSEQKLFEFLSGWLGGPPLYVEKHGHPRMRRRHMRFAIGPEQRDQWLHCMRLALDDTVPNAALREELWQAFAAFADHLRNRAGPSEAPIRRPCNDV